MKGDPLPNDHHVVRYVGGSLVDDGEVDGNAFVRRAHENSPSVNWLEIFEGNIGAQLAEVRRVVRMKLGQTAIFARLRVGYTKQYVKESDENSLEIEFIEDPLPETSDKSEDPSHSLITGLPDPSDTPEAEAIGDLIRQTIIDTFPARG